MALSDGVATKKQVEEAERRMRERRELADHVAALERARTSEPNEWHDPADGTVWTYVVLDGADIRIEHCETATAILRIPSEIGGLPVVSIAADSCTNMDSIEELHIPDSVLSIGACAFRACSNLHKVSLSKNIATFDPHWFRSCKKVEDLTLPGQLEKIDSNLFEITELKRLTISSSVFEIAHGAFARSKLETIEVDADNPFIKTDGHAIYTQDGTVLIALATPLETYTVADGCKVIAKKGFSTFECITQIEFPNTLEELGEFSLSRTMIREFFAPPSLKAIDEKAFFNCTELRTVVLNEGLVSIADNAFTNTAISALAVPASIEQLGNPIAADTDLTYAGENATFRIAEGTAASPANMFLDSQGAMYRNEADGKHLVRMLNPKLSVCEVAPETIAIDKDAFLNHPAIESVIFPEGLTVIASSAFRNCHELVDVQLPSTVEFIGDEAFLDTNLAKISIPPRLAKIGRDALIVQGQHHGRTAPSLTEVEVAPGNPVFKMESGLLLERKNNGALKVLLCTASEEIVRVPSDVDEIADYAFNGRSGIRELWLSDNIISVGIRGLAVECYIELIHVDLHRPVEGHESVDICFPKTDRGIQAQYLSLSVPKAVDIEAMFGNYDNSILNASSFDAMEEAGLKLYEQAQRVVARLLDPILLAPVSRSMGERILSNNIERICVDAAKHDDRELIDHLLDMEFINQENIAGVIESVGRVQDASMIGYLLEANRKMSGSSATFSPDFDL